MSDAQPNPSMMTRARIERFDFIVAALTCVTTTVSFVVAILTPPKGGPFCTTGCVEYPYTDIAAYIPGDFLWMYPALWPAPMLVLLLSGLHKRAPAECQSFARIAVTFAGMAAAILTAVYFIELRYVQPAALRGELDGLAPWSQFNPHGVFIALEEAGYALMGVAFLFAGLALPRESRLVRAVRLIFLGGFTAVAAVFATLSAAYGFDVEYRFEIAVITIDWTVLIVAGALLAILYRTGSAGGALTAEPGA
jgi:hypothetical protein